MLNIQHPDKIREIDIQILKYIYLYDGIECIRHIENISLKIMLELYDKELAERRDKKAYRGKGSRKTTIKTIYGEVEYRRRVYRTETEDGQTAHVFLLDQAMQTASRKAFKQAFAG